MKVCLLYKDRERSEREKYYDTESIIGDLGLKTLILSAAKRLVFENGKLKSVEKEDTYLMETLRNVMMIPLESAGEIKFRQEIIKDCISHEELIRSLYEICSDVIRKWNTLGRGGREKLQQSNPVTRLTEDIKVLHLFIDSLSAIRTLLSERDDLSSAGLGAFKTEFLKTYSAEREEFVKSVLGDISFYTDGSDEEDEGREQVVRPRIVMESGLEDGLKFSSLKLEEVSSRSEKFYKRGSAKYKIREFKNSLTPDSFSTVGDQNIDEQVQQLEFGIVSYITEELKSELEEFRTFFDRLRFQSAFYLAAVQLKEQMERVGGEWCYPGVCDRNDLKFEELRELVMSMQHHVTVVGNTMSLAGKDLVIITGANQGGKSTFLRSIGIAQVMMQCGLPVMAKSFSSGIFPNLFVHFTRREDSEMNSGRLDEELKRMSGIIDRIGDGSLVLLNESFATTTEKEGSVIAYDIIRALRESGVKILTVTHLLSFARRMHDETQGRPESGVQFLSAERKEDGRRTFRMIPHAPELTSFGLDLYEEIVGPVNDKK
jgi:DNA mismatch repair ATPase MutS